MVIGGRGVSIRLLLLLGLVVTAFAYLVLRIWTGQGGALPPASWGALLVLVFMACGVFFAGLPVRRFLRGRATKPLNPIRAMRTVVLAQSAALTGALVTGWYVAQVLVVVAGPGHPLASHSRDHAGGVGRWRSLDGDCRVGGPGNVPGGRESPWRRP